MTDIIYKFVLSILGIIIITLFVSILFKKLTTIIEPNLLDDALNAIDKMSDKINNTFNAIGNFFNAVVTDVALIPIDMGNQIELIGKDSIEDAGSLGIAFGHDMETIGRYLGDCATNFGESLICATTKLENFSTCFKYYFIYTCAKTIYLPISIMVSILRLKNAETFFFECVDKLDCFIYDMFGFYLFHFSDEIQRKCFICELNFPSPPDVSEFNFSNFTFPNNFSNLSDPFGNLVNPLDAFNNI